MSHTLALITGLATAFLITIGVYCIPEFFIRRKNKKLFNSVQIGDKYIQKLYQPDPFKCQYYQIVEITDKAVNSEGDMYVRYRIVDDNDDMPPLNSSCRIDDFIDIYHYEPYNNQDKKQQ